MKYQAYGERPTSIRDPIHQIIVSHLKQTRYLFFMGTSLTHHFHEVSITNSHNDEPFPSHI